MIAILEKYEHNVDFHQIVDFVEASHIRYALTINPTVYVFYIQQFWSTARIKTMDEGTKILATVDGKPRTIFESSIRRNLKLNDEAGISSLLDAELFENLALLGYNIVPNQKISFQKGQFSHQWKYLIHSIMQCLSPKSTGFNEFSSNIATAVVCLATNRVYNFLKMIFDDELASPLGDDSQGEACPTVFGLEAGHDRANIINSSTLPHDSTPRVTSLAADEGTRIKLLEDKDGGVDEPSGEAATIKGRNLETKEEATVEKSTKRGSNDTEELVNVLTSLDAASILTSGVQVVSVPPTAKVPTKQIKDSVPMASKEEGERFKRKWLKLEQDSVKKMKTSEEVSKEDLKAMMQLVPVEEVYVEAL
nr:synaptobrevin, longin-like domain protein [Tanacetum cinerariifolium]